MDYNTNFNFNLNQIKSGHMLNKIFNLFREKEINILKKYYRKEIYFQVFNDLLYLLKDSNLSSDDLDKIFSYFEAKLSN